MYVRPVTDEWPSMIPAELPDEVLMCMVVVAPELLPGQLQEGVPEGMVGAGVQVTLNCDLEVAVAALTGLLTTMTRDLRRQRAARTN